MSGAQKRILSLLEGYPSSFGGVEVASSAAAHSEYMDRVMRSRPGHWFLVGFERNYRGRTLRTGTGTFDVAKHLHMRRLVIESDSLPFPLSTFERSYRYTKYGYGICKDSKVRLLIQLASFNPGDISLETMSQALYDGMD